MTGQELMDVLSEEFDYVWQETVVGGFSPEAGMTERTVYMYGATMVDQPFDFAATAYASAEADAHADRGAIDILTQLLAPDMATWIADALEQGLSSEETFSVTTRTPSGGYVTAQVVREKLVQDWVNVTFSPVDPRLQEP